MTWVDCKLEAWAIMRRWWWNFLLPFCWFPLCELADSRNYFVNKPFFSNLHKRCNAEMGFVLMATSSQSSSSGSSRVGSPRKRWKKLPAVVGSHSLIHASSRKLVSASEFQWIWGCLFYSLFLVDQEYKSCNNIQGWRIFSSVRDGVRCVWIMWLITEWWWLMWWVRQVVSGLTLDQVGAQQMKHERWTVCCMKQWFCYQAWE